MKETTLEQFVQDPSAFVAAAQHGRLLITQDGRPLAVVIGVENKDEEDLDLESSPEFWRMIEQRRARPTMPLGDVEAALFADESPE